MKLKYLTKSIIAGALGICILSSCSDEYLDKKVDVSETQEKIYSDSAKVANVINDFYSSIGYSFAYVLIDVVWIFPPKNPKLERLRAGWGCIWLRIR
jgi:C4-dicarboxylate transporter